MSPISTSNLSELARWAPRVVLLSTIIGGLAIFSVLLPGPFYRFGLYGLGVAFAMIKDGAYGGIPAVFIALIGLILILLARRPQYFIGVIIGSVLGSIAWGIPYVA
ncbi:MAG TPA: hypothetical protein VNI53_01670 [Gammaproteobacteria bacterium]|nr:hypothetical protein [Gammaproteobacteria bacterium]